MLDGQEKAASLTEPYKIGFAQGKSDYLILRNDATDVCKKFPGRSSDTLTPNGECIRGYIDGPAALVNNTQKAQTTPPSGVTAINCTNTNNNATDSCYNSGLRHGLYDGSNSRMSGYSLTLGQGEQYLLWQMEITIIQKNNQASVKGAYKNVISAERMFVKSYVQLWQSQNDLTVRRLSCMNEDLPVMS